VKRDVTVVAAMLIGLLVCGGWADAPGAVEDGGDDVASKPISYALPRKLATLANPNITESSGLACSRLRQGVFWTHNDSGDGPYLYAFDRDGKHLAVFRVAGAAARDWEDMASVRIGERSYLVCGDIGDNARKRSNCVLYFVEEPDLTEPVEGVGEARMAQKVVFAYEDGPRDAECVAVDRASGNVYLVSKNKTGKCKVYELNVSSGEDDPMPKAKPIATLAVPMTTALDISPDGRRAIVLTYVAAYEFTRRPD